MSILIQLLIAAAVGWFLRGGGVLKAPEPTPNPLPPHLLDLLRQLHAEHQKKEALGLVQSLAKIKE